MTYRIGTRITILVILLMLSMAPLVANEPWTYGYKISMDGFSKDSEFQRQEHMGLYAHFSFFNRKFFNPSFSMGAMFPLWPDTRSLLCEASVDISLWYLQDHPFAWMFRRTSALVPKIQASYILDAYDVKQSYISLVVQPFSWHFGEKIISVLGFRIVSKVDDIKPEWAIRLLEITHYID